MRKPTFWFPTWSDTNHAVQLQKMVRGLKGPVSWYGKLTWESAHAWNLIISCTFVAFGMTTIIMVHLIFYVIPLSIYDVMYDITTKPEGTLL